MATEQQLIEARAALHKLQIGRSVVSVSQDGVTTSYKQADIASLRNYVESLERDLGVTSTRRLRPAGLF